VTLSMDPREIQNTIERIQNLLVVRCALPQRSG
jgi:hypothetical protein